MIIRDGTVSNKCERAVCYKELRTFAAQESKDDMLDPIKMGGLPWDIQVELFRGYGSTNITRETRCALFEPLIDYGQQSIS